MSATRLPLLLLVLLSFLWGYSWVFQKLAMLDSGPFTFAGLRTCGGALCLLAALRLSGRSFWPGRLRELVLLGLVNTTCSVGCSQWALVSGAANRTSILMYTMPFMTLLLARPMLGEKVRGPEWLAIACAAAGLAVVVRPWQGQGPSLSQLLILCAAFFWALSSIMTKRLQQRAPMDPLALTAWQMSFGAPPLLLLAWWSGESLPVLTDRFLLALGVTTLLSTALGWYLWAWLLRVLPAGFASMMTLMAPVVAVSTSSLHLGEPLAGHDVAGVGLILAGLLVLSATVIARQRRMRVARSAPD